MLKRTLRHLMMTPWRLRHSFPSEALAEIESAIAKSEAAHQGEVRFAVEGALDSLSLIKGLSARERAVEVFSELRVWDTEHNNGVLVYLLLADHDVEILADRGINAKVPAEHWESICREMESFFTQGNYPQGVITGIQAITQLLAKHFPAPDGNANELTDRPAVL